MVEDAEDRARRVADALEQVLALAGGAQAPRARAAFQAHAEGFSWERLAPRYDRWIEAAARAGPPAVPGAGVPIGPG